MRPGAFSTVITTDTTASSLIVGANSINSPTTWTGGIKAGSAAFTSGIALDGGAVPTHGLTLSSATPASVIDTLYNASSALIWHPTGVGALPAFSAGVRIVAANNANTTDNARIVLISGTAGSSVINFGTSANQGLAGLTWDQTSLTFLGGPVIVPSSLTAGSGTVAITDTTGKLATFDTTHYQSMSGANFTNIPTSAVSTGNFVATVSSGTGITSSVTSGNAAATAISLNNTAVSAASYGSSTSIPSFTVDAQGRLTAAAGNVVIAPAGTLTGATLAANVLASSLTSAGTLTGGATGAGFTVALGTSTITGQLALTNGGTAASLTASNGGIFYSTASAGAILSGTATAGQILRSGASAAPTWSTATYPATAGSSNNALVSDGTNFASTAIVNSITGTSNQVVASAATGGVTLSLPQSIATTSNVQHLSIGLGGAARGSDGNAFHTAGSRALTSGFDANDFQGSWTIATNASAAVLAFDATTITAATGTHASLPVIRVDPAYTDTGATITAAVGIDIATFTTFSHMTNAYGLRVAAPGAGAGTVYTAQFAGTSGVNIFRSGAMSLNNTTDPGVGNISVDTIRFNNGFHSPGSTTPVLGTACPASSGSVNWFGISFGGTIGYIPVWQ